MIYFISDLHFGHQNILKFERTQFKNIQEHDEYLISSYNSIVKKQDTCYILGDISGPIRSVSQEYVQNCFNRMNGIKILVLGNHDEYPLTFYQHLNNVQEVYSNPVYIRKRIALSHEPIEVGKSVINIHGHLHNSSLSLSNYINVSADIIKYTPLSLKYIEGTFLPKLPKQDGRFMYEWFAPYYTFTGKRDDIVFNDDGSIDLLATRKKLQS